MTKRYMISLSVELLVIEISSQVLVSVVNFSDVTINATVALFNHSYHTISVLVVLGRIILDFTG